MKKYLVIILILFQLLATAKTKYNQKFKEFQKFDNRVSFGIMQGAGTLTVGNQFNNSNTFSYNSLSLEVEKLFDIGLWLDATITNINTYVQDGVNMTPLGSYPLLATFNGKLGYDFPILKNHFSLLPYLLIGKNANIASLTAVTNGVSNNIGITQDFFWTLGIGGRIEYIINKYLYIYLDQYVARNKDNSPALNVSVADNTTVDKVDATNTQYTTSLGLKVNLATDLQLGLGLYFSKFTGYDQNALRFFNAYSSTKGVGSPAGMTNTDYGLHMQIGWTFK